VPIPVEQIRHHAQVPTCRFGWFFMLGEDLAAFGREVEGRCIDVTWSTTNRGVAFHRDITEAAAASRLVRIVTNEVGPPIWLWPPALYDDITLRAGSMAYKYDGNEYSDEAIQSLDSLAAGVRNALAATTTPHVVDGSGKRRHNYRIGVEAEQWFRSTKRACLKAESTYETFGLPDGPDRPDLRPTST
jgi:hypothetical protein